MVCADSGRTPPPPLDSMAMGLDRSKPLHNFNLPFLKWGNQKYLRCMKLDSDADADPDLPPPLVRRPPPAGGNHGKFHADRPAKRFRASKFKIHDDYAADEGIAAVREKLMVDLKTAADKMKVTFWRDGVVDDDDEENPNKKTPAPPRTTAPVPAPSSPPWSLRVRKAASKRAEKREIRESPVRSGDGGGGGGGKSPRRRSVTENEEREKFSVSLSKKEIEEDFMAMIERRPPRRPKKRPRIVQNEIDTIFPGLWLTEITADLYAVPETQQTEKR